MAFNLWWMVGEGFVISLHQNGGSVLSLSPFQLPPVQGRAALWKREMLNWREPKEIGTKPPAAHTAFVTQAPWAQEGQKEIK